jgi:hypothetical protein
MIQECPESGIGGTCRAELCRNILKQDDRRTQSIVVTAKRGESLRLRKVARWCNDDIVSLIRRIPEVIGEEVLRSSNTVQEDSNREDTAPPTDHVH